MRRKLSTPLAAALASFAALAPAAAPEAAVPLRPPLDLVLERSCTVHQAAYGFRRLVKRTSPDRCRARCEKFLAPRPGEAGCYYGDETLFKRAAAPGAAKAAAGLAQKRLNWFSNNVRRGQESKADKHWAEYLGFAAAAGLRAWDRDDAEALIAEGEKPKAKAAVSADRPARPGPPEAETGFAPEGYELAFADEFDRLRLRDWWEEGAVGWYDYWIEWGIRSLENNRDLGVKLKDETELASGRTAGEAMEEAGFPGFDRYFHEVSNGTLKLRAFPIPRKLQDEFWTAPYAASMISAEDWFSHRYGYWEVRAKVNAIGPGHHLAIWLLPDDDTWPPEFDLMEVVGTSPNTFHANSHPKDGRFPMTNFAAPNGATGWHTFGLEWTPDAITWTVDGEVVRERPNYVTDKKMYPLVSWEIAGHWPGEPDASTPWPAEAEIDYIRVYQK